jgi:hypothetical protein
MILTGSCHNSGGRSPAFYRGGPGSIPSHVKFVVGKVALGQIFSEYFGFPCQLASHQLLHIR